MPMIDVYAVEGIFSDTHQLARDLAGTLMAIEEVPDIPPPAKPDRWEFPQGPRTSACCDYTKAVAPNR
ncbi:hypothetical protein [Nocardia sp. NPDC005998]|uniref:hypothetical protein n=1 Tax=Nocardia sp. NPDC005998 TaxID=3156894 RepID=UPI0033A5D623